MVVFILILTQNLTNPITSFIEDDDEGLISAEKNKGNYVQWALFIKKNILFCQKLLSI